MDVCHFVLNSKLHYQALYLPVSWSAIIHSQKPAVCSTTAQINGFLSFTSVRYFTLAARLSKPLSSIHRRPTSRPSQVSVRGQNKNKRSENRTMHISET